MSNDDKMGEDTVIGCVSAGGKVEALLSWNDGRNNVPMIEKFGNVVLLNGSNVDGDLYCQLQIDTYIEVSPPLAGAKSRHYDLSLGEYYVLLASGHTLPSGQLSYHADMRLVSGHRVSMARVAQVQGKEELLVKCHSMIMVIVWLGCAGSGIILARYYKHTWRDADCCGQAQWFIWHRSVNEMTSALGCQQINASFTYI